jgi:hypothetical protein
MKNTAAMQPNSRRTKSLSPFSVRKVMPCQAMKAVAARKTALIGVSHSPANSNRAGP